MLPLQQRLYSFPAAKTTENCSKTIEFESTKSAVLGLQVLLHARLADFLHYDRRALQLFDYARSILSVTHGSDHLLLVDIRKRIDFLSRICSTA